MLSELGNFFLAMGVGFASVQAFASFWGTYRNDPRYLSLGWVAAFLQGGVLSASFVILIVAFLVCDFSLLLVSLHDHTQLPWYYRLAASWGNHEGSLLLFVLILAGMGVAQAVFLQNPLFRARTLTIQGLLTLSFLIFLCVSSNPFTFLPFSVGEGKSLNPLLQDRGLLAHPPLLYLGYVGFSAPFSMALAALWGEEKGQEWANLARPWVLFSWATLTAGITLGSWWAYYELGWGGWWFWDPVENASLMPWLAATALLHTLRTGQLYRWSLFLSLLTFGLSLLGTFLVRSGLVTSIHSFAHDPERGFYILTLLGLIMGVAFFMWVWKAPRLQGTALTLFSRQGALLIHSLWVSMGILTVVLGTFYPLWSDWFWGKTVAIGAPYFDRTFIPLMMPVLIFLPLGCLFREREESLLPFLIAPLTATLGIAVLLLYCFYPLSLWAIAGITASVWVIGGTMVAYGKGRLSLGPTLAHIGVGLSLLGVSAGGGLRTDKMEILGVGESMTIGGGGLTLRDIQQGKEATYLYERATLSYGKKTLLTPEKRLYLPQNSLLSKTAISTNGLKDLYVILGPYQGNNRWLIRASSIPLAPWIWIGGAFMVLGAVLSFLSVCLRIFQHSRSPFVLSVGPVGAEVEGSKGFITSPFDFGPFDPSTSSGLRALRSGRTALKFFFFLLFLPLASFAMTPLEKRALVLYQEVRCPVCLGQSIADSETEESQRIKTFILTKLKKGESEEAIRENLRSVFGEEILLRPSLEDHLFLWLAPFGVFFLIILGLMWKAKRTNKKILNLSA